MYTGPRKKNKLLNFQGLISRVRLVYKHNPNYFRPKSDAYVSIQVMLIGPLFCIYQDHALEIKRLLELKGVVGGWDLQVAVVRRH